MSPLRSLGLFALENDPSLRAILVGGAMLAVELVEPGTHKPDAALTSAVAKACHAEGVIALTAGTFGNVLRFLPPLVIGQDLLTEALDVLDAAFDAHAGR